jgi:hypothetical protein
MTSCHYRQRDGSDRHSAKVAQTSVCSFDAFPAVSILQPSTRSSEHPFRVLNDGSRDLPDLRNNTGCNWHLFAP